VERIDENHLTAFTDGSMKERPRRGGYAFIFVTVNLDGSERVDEFSPNGIPGASNQDMEIIAVREALAKALERRGPVDLSRFTRMVIYTDSTTVHDGYQAARWRWQRNQWRGKGGRPILHAELWREIIRLADKLPFALEIRRTPGKKSKYTKLVDRLAKDSAERPFGPPMPGRTVRRKRSPDSVDPGQVPLSGQILEIQVVSSRFVPQTKGFLHKYEVVSGDLEGAVDEAFGEALKTSDRYRVRMNHDRDHPEFAEVLGVTGKADRRSA
jgi:ribonuclease HI